MSSSDDEECNNNKPKPNDFEAYMPWACHQLQIETALLITKVHQQEYVSVSISDRSKSKSKGKIKATASQAGLEPDIEDKSGSFQTMAVSKPDRVLKLNAVYDKFDRLVQIQFEKNTTIPTIMMKVFGLIIQFQMHLTSLVINKGLDKYIMHELHKMLPMSHITDLYLDDTYLREANYHILLETPNSLKHLSLVRCELEDIGIKEMAIQLTYPAPASKTLCVLNLSTNRITDIGAKYLANALRSNRQLIYLNLAGNMITDDGAANIFDTIKEFTLTPEELLDTRSRRMDYLSYKKALIEKIIKDLKTAELEKKGSKKKMTKLPLNGLKKSTVSSKAMEADGTLPDGGLSLFNMDYILYEKAELLAQTIMGECKEPFSSTNTFVVHDVVHCYGNNTLCYLNFAYNNLSYLFLKKLLQILMYQKIMSRKPRGLINVIIEGNCFPENCKELVEIDDLLDMSLSMQGRSASTKKKPPQKVSAK